MNIAFKVNSAPRHQTVAIGDIAKVVTKGTTPTSVGFAFEDAGINFVKVESIASDGSFVPRKLAKISLACHAALQRSQLQSGDILFSIAGALGRTAIVEEDILPANTNQAVAIIRLKADVDVDRRYLLYALSPSLMIEQVEQNRGGVAQQNLSLGQLKAFQIPLPVLEKQKRIVTVLDQAFAALDRARANAEANLADAEELFDRWLTAVFHEHPSSWKVTRLSQLCHRITVGHVGPMAERYTSSGTPFLRSQNVRPFYVDLANVKFIDDKFRSELKKSELMPGDVAIVRTGYPGTAAVIPDDLPVANCADLVIARPKEGLEPEFLAMFLNSSFGKKIVAEKAVGAAQKHFNVGAAKNVDFAYPELREQRELVNRAAEMRKYSAGLVRQFGAKLRDIDQLRQSILANAFAGELT